MTSIQIATGGLWLSIGMIGIAAVSEPVPIAEPTLAPQVRRSAQSAIHRGLRYLADSQREDGGWEAFDKSHPAITSLVVKCLVQDEQYGSQHPSAKRGLDFILRYVQPDGGIYAPGEGMRNYHTSVALMALAAANDPAYRDVLRKAQRFLIDLQWDSGEGHEVSSSWYGGAGYGPKKRPDLSNTQMMLEALKQSGLAPDNPVYKKALVFVSRCQMLGGTNDQSFASESVDGGFVYTPVGGGESKAGTLMWDGKPRLRSYGSMTYAGFKSMLFAEVDRDDVRVRRATEWIRKHYTLDSNPNMPWTISKQGLYYYYHTFARALDAWGEETIVDGDNVPRAWREDLCRKLISLQEPGGSWVNDEDRWYEGNAHLVTAYAILALQTALDK